MNRVLPGKNQLRSLLAGMLSMACLPMLSLAPQPAMAEAQQQPAAVKEKKAPTQTLESLAMSWLKRQDLQHDMIGLEIMELPGGRTLYGYNGNRRFVPASTAKVFTTSFAIDSLGTNFTYKTRLLAGGPIEDETIRGDLIIEPSQDPSFTRQDLRNLLAGLRDKKITHIEGTVRIAAVPGGYEHFLPGWLIEDWGQEWMPVSSNLVLDRNIAPGAQPIKGIKIVTESATAGHSALNHTLLNSGISAGWLTYNPELKEMRLFLSPGMSPKAPLVISNPEEFNRAIAISILQEMGIKISNKKQSSDTTDSGTLVSEHSSKPLSAIVQTCLHESDNLYAQQLLRTMGAQKSRGAGPTSLEERGLNAMATWFSSIGVPPQEAVLFDGCGLSRKNCISPHALCSVLRHIAGGGVSSPYLGLLKYSDNGSKKGNFRYKTGAMDSVRALAGVLETAGGQKLSVAIIVNGHTPSTKGLRSSLTELVAFLNTITSMTTPPSKPEDAGKPPVVEITTAARSSIRSSQSRKGTRHRASRSGRRRR